MLILHSGHGHGGSPDPELLLGPDANVMLSFADLLASLPESVGEFWLGEVTEAVI